MNWAMVGFFLALFALWFVCDWVDTQTRLAERRRREDGPR